MGAPQGPSTHYLRFLVPKTIVLLVFGTRELTHWVLEPPGSGLCRKALGTIGSPNLERAPSFAKEPRRFCGSTTVTFADALIMEAVINRGPTEKINIRTPRATVSGIALLLGP